MKTTKSILESFKNEESNENSIDRLVFFNKSPELIEGIIAWKNIEVHYDGDQIIDEQINENQLWIDLWDYSDFDKSDFCTALGLDNKNGMKLLQRLAMLRFIYPDGTVNKAAFAYARNIVRTMIKKVSTKQKE